jgi:hypothetical protein
MNEKPERYRNDVRQEVKMAPYKPQNRSICEKGIWIGLENSREPDAVSVRFKGIEILQPYI